MGSKTGKGSRGASAQVDFASLWERIPEVEKEKYEATGINSPEALELAFTTFSEVLATLLPNFVDFFNTFRYACDQLPESDKLRIRTLFLGPGLKVVGNAADGEAE